jgi:hypothetical protein
MFKKQYSPNFSFSWTRKVVLFITITYIIWIITSLVFNMDNTDTKQVSIKKKKKVFITFLFKLKSCYF